jgi:hypothetical protein
MAKPGTTEGIVDTRPPGLQGSERTIGLRLQDVGSGVEPGLSMYKLRNLLQ